VSQASTGPILVILHSEPDGSLSVLVDAAWRSSVAEEDLEEVEAILEDLSDRAALHPASLFEHLAEINSGCLVTAAKGEGISENPSIAVLLPRFRRAGGSANS